MAQGVKGDAQKGGPLEVDITAQQIECPRLPQEIWEKIAGRLMILLHHMRKRVQGFHQACHEFRSLPWRSFMIESICQTKDDGATARMHRHHRLHQRRTSYFTFVPLLV